MEHSFIALAIRLQFDFSARISEIPKLEWGWVDLDNRRIAWPDSKIGGMSRTMNPADARGTANELKEATDANRHFRSDW